MWGLLITKSKFKKLKWIQYGSQVEKNLLWFIYTQEFVCCICF